MAHPFGERALVEQTASIEPMALDNFGAGFMLAVNRHSTVTHYQRPNMTHPRRVGQVGRSQRSSFSQRSRNDGLA